jgi:hypothetical protein
VTGEEKEFDPVRKQEKEKWEKLQTERAEVVAAAEHRYATVEFAANK